MDRQKRKGGAEKIRDKKNKSLQADAAKCSKISELFSRQQPVQNIPGPSNVETLVEENVAEIESDTPDPSIVIHPMEQETNVPVYEHQTEALPDDIVVVETEECCMEQEGDKSQDCSESNSSSCRPSSEPQSAFNYFSCPNSSQLSMFFNYHPKQNVTDPVIKKSLLRKDGSNRRWLTYCEEKQAVFCSVCLAFSKVSSTNPFIEGMTDRRHIHQRIEEHEKSVMHKFCAEAYFLKASSANINNLLLCNQMSAHREQVRKRRQILERVIDIVKVIGKRGLSYRGDKFEAAYTLEDLSLDHGNFLEFVLLLSKYDVCLQEHVRDCVAKSKTLHSRGKGRGSLITLLSKTTVNKVIEAIRQLIQETVAGEVREAGMFSVQIDTTQDITSRDQCSIILRYVTDCIHEKLLAVVDCESSTGESLLHLLMHVLQSCKIDIKNCIASSTDGAANMQGQYRGFSAWLSTESPGQVHVWCYAHVLNLVLAEATKVVLPSASLFNLINDVAVFIRESYQRMNTWLNVSQDPHHRRLSVICETRWWSKDVALRKIFGSFAKPDSAWYIDLILTLQKIQENPRSQPEVRVRAKSYIDSLLKYETVITAQIFLRIFELTSPLSKYLQTSGLDILTAHHMVSGTQEHLKKLSRDFDFVKKTTDDFIKWANDKLQEIDDCEFEAQVTLPQKRLRRKKTMAGECSQDEVIADVISAYKIQVHNVILDVITQSMNQRFLTSRTLYADYACLDPRNFPEIRDKGLQRPALEELSKLLLKFDERATTDNLRCELTSLALHWDKLKTSALEEYNVRVARETPVEDQGTKYDDTETELVNKPCASCKNCAICCYQILRRYNLLTDSYNVIGLAYKFLLTLSFTQVACERTFSTLKFIKNRLRNAMSQEHLDSFMLMATEKDILMSLDLDGVINKVAEKSEVLRNLLIP